MTVIVVVVVGGMCCWPPVIVGCETIRCIASVSNRDTVVRV